MIHVACLAAYPWPGYPSSIFIKEQMELVAQAPGVRVTYLALLPEVPFFLRHVPRYRKYAGIPREIPNPYYRVLRLPHYLPVPGGNRAWAVNGIQLALNAAPLLAAIRRDHPGDRLLLHTHWLLPSGLAGVLLAKWFDLPHVCTAHHGGMRQETKNSKFLRFLYQMVIQRTTHLLAVGDDLRRQINELSPAAAVEVVHLGARSDLFFPVSAARKLALKKKLLGEHAGEFLVIGPRVNETNKGLWELLEAFRRLRAQGQPLFLALLGGEFETAAARQYLRRHGLLEAAFLSEAWLDRQEIVPWFQAADLLVLPSYSEGLPLSMIEAMMSHVPCAITPVGAVPSVLKHGETGYALAVRSAESIVEMFAAFLARPEWFKQMADNAARVAAAQHDMKLGVRKLLDLYERAARQPKTPAA